MQETDILRSALSIIEGLLDAHDLKSAELLSAKQETKTAKDTAQRAQRVVSDDHDKLMQSEVRRLQDKLERVRSFAIKELSSVSAQAINEIIG